jgi:hypothetical protein
VLVAVPGSRSGFKPCTVRPFSVWPVRGLNPDDAGGRQLGKSGNSVMIALAPLSHVIQPLPLATTAPLLRTAFTLVVATPINTLVYRRIFCISLYQHTVHSDIPLAMDNPTEEITRVVHKLCQGSPAEQVKTPTMIILDTLC